MVFERKYLIPTLVGAACLLLVGAWKLSRDDSSEANYRSEVMPLDGVQSVDVNKSKISLAALESAASAASKSPPIPTLPSDHDAAGTLNDQVERAIAVNDGPMAANLANKLKECDINLKILEVESAQGANPNTDTELQAVRMGRLLEYQRNISSCQTVPGDQKQVRLRLLNLAIQQGVVGAATESFYAGSREPATLSHMVSDAHAGDVTALVNVAMYDTKVFGITRDEQDAARYALKLASADPAVGARVVNYLKIAESYAVPNSNFDWSGISSVARTNGVGIAERIKERLGKKTS